jgi:hypothetical protein
MSIPGNYIRLTAHPLEIGDFVAFVIYPLTTTEPPGEWSPGIPLRSAIGWETAARNLLK